MTIMQEVETIYKESDYGSGSRIQGCQIVLKLLTANLLKRGASVYDIATFQSDFCNLNGITVPDSFFPKGVTIEDFLNEKLMPCDKNVSGKDVFNCYVEWCKINKINPKTKREFFFELRNRNLLHERGKINGQTWHNVLKGYKIGGN